MERFFDVLKFRILGFETILRILWIACATLAIVCVVMMIVNHLKKRGIKYEQIVMQHSQRLYQLRELNQKYSFWRLQPMCKWTCNVNSKRKCDSFDFDAFFQTVILREEQHLLEVLEGAEFNNSLLPLYQEAVAGIEVHVTPEGARKYSVPYQRFVEIEDRLFVQETCRPVTNPLFVCKVVYVSPMGRSYCEREKHYDVYGLVEQRQIALKRKHEMEQGENQRRSERNKMTASMRYDVLNRDGHKCVICGRNVEDGIKLVIDHIKPIAKGGKTELSNLRTLCETCNAGKRDKYNPYGYN